MLNPLKDQIYAVRGNCDTEVDQMVLQFPILADYALLVLDGKTFYATHGHVFNQDHLLLCRLEIFWYMDIHIC